MRYDLAVIGGGIIGTGIARDAALRGLRVALFEKDDFGSGTTSRSTRIIHGGLRYLEKLDFGLVFEALHERRRLLENAPHLVAPLPFLFPVYRKRGHALTTLWAGISMYDAMNVRRGMPHHRILPAKLAHRLEPALRPEGLQAGFVYYDGQCQYPERLCIENVIDAAAHGARIENHSRVVAFLRNGETVHGVRIRHENDGHEEDVEAALVLNASGPWLDEVERLRIPEAVPKLRRTKGVHLVVARFNHHALIMETQDAKRVFFAIPWGDYTLLGTTDTDYEGPNETVASDDDDVAYLLREIKSVLDIDVQPAQILFTTAGLRPLRRQVGRSTADITRKHEIVDNQKTEGVRGLLTVVGGKITTFRQIAQDAVDAVYAKLDRPVAPCQTTERALPGGRVHDWGDFCRAFRDEARGIVETATIEHWLNVYGVRARALLELVRGKPDLAKPIEAGLPYVVAEVDLAVEEEFCGSLQDFMFRRCMWGLQAGQGAESARGVAELLALRLGWEPGRTQREVRAYEDCLERMRPRSSATETSP